MHALSLSLSALFFSLSTLCLTAILLSSLQRYLLRFRRKRGGQWGKGGGQLRVKVLEEAMLDREVGKRKLCYSA